MKLDYLAAINVETETTNVIGYLCWYSVREGLYKREELKKKIQIAGLSDSYLPNPIRPSDAFKRATKAIEKSNIPSEEEGVLKNYLIRNVFASPKVVQRNLVKEIRDPKGKRLIYDPALAEFVLNREDNTFVVEKWPKDDEMAEELVEEAERLYELFLTHHDASAVRRSVQSMLKKMSPTPVVPRMYIIPAKYYTNLESMIRFLKSLQTSRVAKVPLIDTRETRDMVRDHLHDHLKQTLRNCHELLRNPKAQKVQVQTMINDARQIIQGFNDYREIITDSIDEMENQIELIKQQVQLLFEKELDY